jgi:predicted nucleic acid-binding protein
MLDIGHSSFDSRRVGSDNAFLECALEGKADYLVTKNIRHFPLKEKKG